jgi:spore maturation protein SpmB
MSTISIPYGAAYSFNAPIVKAGSTDIALSADWTPATGDVKVIKDGGAAANIATLPVFIASTGILTWSLSATECTATEIIIQVIDSATKAVQDQVFRLQTTKASALQVGIPQATQAAGDTVITLDATAAGQTDFYKGSVIAITSGSGANQARIITAYNGTTKVATIDRAWDVALVIAAGSTQSIFAVFPQGLNQPLTSAQTTSAVPTTAQIATEVFDTQTVETGLTFRQSLRLASAVLFGRRSGTGSGTEVFNAAVTNAKARVTGTIDGTGNRTNVTTDGT